MLTRLKLEHFKCFEKLVLPLERLTLLAGTNASGKSSVLQSLALLHQTMREHEWATRLVLNGTDLSLGTVTDIVDQLSSLRSFSIGLVEDEWSVEWCFEGERHAMSAELSRIRVGTQNHDRPTTLRFLLPQNVAPQDKDVAERIRRLCYLTAERVGPREVYPLVDRALGTSVGCRGENAVSVLFWGRDEDVLAPLVVPQVPPTRMRQVEAWMREFFPACTLDVQQVPQANAVTLGIRTTDATSFHRPVNVGFGLTQVLPIIIAALSATTDDLLLIENPEVHLHPAGQARMGRFLAQVAAAGVQVIIETHSDHVLNGIRRAVKVKQIDSSHVMLHFFRNRGSDGSQVVSPTLDGDGNVDVWPDGFFDQFDKDASYFAGWGH